MSKFANTAAMAAGLVLTLAGSYAHAQYPRVHSPEGLRDRYRLPIMPLTQIPQPTQRATRPDFAPMAPLAQIPQPSGRATRPDFAPMAPLSRYPFPGVPGGTERPIWTQ